MEPSYHSTTQIDHKPYLLADLDQLSWQQLTAAPTEKENGFRTFVLSTLTTGNNLPDARTVVLRQANQATRTLWFHTDKRAQKVAQLRQLPDALLLFWDEKSQVQLRCRVNTQIHTNDVLADAQWAAIGEGTRKMYLSEHEPGSVQPAPYPGFPVVLGEEKPTRAESEEGRPNFAAVACTVLTMDYLHLSRAGQTRALFEYGGENIHQQWLAP
jgi:pyridoxamine 5'-phosphate oxidase